MENYKGRYIKVLKKNLGGDSSKYNTGDYLKVIEDKGKLCIEVEYAGVLNVRAFNNRINNGDIEMMPVGFTPEFILPEKWAIKLTRENYEILGQWRTDGPIPRVEQFLTDQYFLHTPMALKKGYNALGKNSEYTEITLEQFETYVLQTSKQKNSFPILDKFPETGCCNTTDKVFVDFLIKNFGITDSKTSVRSSTAIGWNSKSYWYLRSVNSSGKPKFDISQLEPFYKKESYSDYIEKIRKENKKEQEEKQLIFKTVDYEKSSNRSQKSCNSTKICGSDIKIRQADPIRGISLRSSKSKIRIRSNNSDY